LKKQNTRAKISQSIKNEKKTEDYKHCQQPQQPQQQTINTNRTHADCETQTASLVTPRCTFRPSCRSRRCRCFRRRYCSYTNTATEGWLQQHRHGSRPFNNNNK